MNEKFINPSLEEVIKINLIYNKKKLEFLMFIDMELINIIIS